MSKNSQNEYFNKSLYGINQFIPNKYQCFKKLQKNKLLNLNKCLYIQHFSKNYIFIFENWLF